MKQAVFFWGWWSGVFAGVFAKIEFLNVVFCGEFVVERVVNVVKRHHVVEA